MTDVAIIASQTKAVPQDYTIPGAQEILPKSVTATMDGTGAATSWKPCLQVIDPGGHVMFSAVGTATIAAGVSADVSWFPGLTASDQSSVTGSLMGARVQIVGDFPIADDDPGTLITWGEAAFDLGTPTAMWQAGTPRRLFAPVAGYYTSIVNPIWDIYNIGLNNFSQLAIYLYKNTETVTLTGSFEKVNCYPVATQDFTFMGASHGVFHLNAGDYLVCNCYVNSGGGGGAATSLLDLRTHVGQPPLVTHWQLFLLAAD